MARLTNIAARVSRGTAAPAVHARRAGARRILNSAAKPRGAAARSHPSRSTLPRPVTAGLSHVATSVPSTPTARQSSSWHRPQFQHADADAAPSFPLGSPAGGFAYSFDETLEPSPVNAELRSRVSRAGGHDREKPVRRRHFVSTHGLPQLSRAGFNDDAIKSSCATRNAARQVAAAERAWRGGGSGGAGPVVTPNDTRFDPPFEGNLIEAALSMRTSTDTAVFSLNYGLTIAGMSACSFPRAREA